MGSVEEKPADDHVAHFRGMARHYQTLAMAELHEAQSDLFATIAADYAELAKEAAAARAMGEPARADPDSLTRWIQWVGRWRRPVAPLTSPLTLPPAPLGVPAATSGAK